MQVDYIHKIKMVLAFTQRLPVKKELHVDCVWDLVANETQHMHERHGTFQGGERLCTRSNKHGVRIFGMQLWR